MSASLARVRASTSAKLAGHPLPLAFQQATVASAANAYSRTTKSARVSRRRLNDKVEKIQAAEVVS